MNSTELIAFVGLVAFVAIGVRFTNAKIKNDSAIATDTNRIANYLEMKCDPGAR